MATYRLRLTPDAVNRNTEGSLDNSLVDGYSIQRTGYMEVYSSTNRKIVICDDGDTFTDTMESWSDAGDDNIVAV